MTLPVPNGLLISDAIVDVLLSEKEAGLISLWKYVGTEWDGLRT